MERSDGSAAVKGELGSRTFVECHLANGNQLLVNVDWIVAAEECKSKRMQIHCVGHSFDISEHDYERIERVLKEARGYRIV